MASNKSDLSNGSPTAANGLETSERNAADDSSSSNKNNGKVVNSGGLHDGTPFSTAATTQAQTLPGHPTRALSPRSAAAAAVEAEHLRYGHIEFENIHESEEDKRRHYLLRKPKVKQWFYKGKLFRSAEGRASARIELFFDLIFVAIIAVLAEAAIEDPSGNGLVRYIITYWAAYMIWSGLRENMNMFWNDDVLQKTFVMWIMILLITYGNNAPYIKDAPSESHGGGAEEGGETAGPATTAGEAATAAGEVGHAAIRLLKRAESEGAIHHYVGGGRTTTILVYIVADVSLVLGRLGYSFYVHQVRRQLRIQSVLTIVPIALYIAAIFTSVGAAIALVVVGLAWEYASWTAVFSPWLKKYMRLEYSSALNIEHEIERHADFFTIVIGEFIYSSISGAPAGLGIDKATGRAALILLSAASLQLMYMFSSGCVTFVHPLRHSGLYAATWFTLHIPAVAALTLAGDAGAVLITQNTGVAQGVRWFFSAGVGIGVLCIAMLATLEREKDDDILVMRKRHRLIPRYIVGIILLFLPLTDEETLTSTSLTGIVAALLYATLIYETIFGLHRRQTITGKPETGWKRFFPQFMDPELAHRDVHRVDEEMYEDPDVLGGPDR